MKTQLLFLLLFGQILMVDGQSIQINQITPTTVSGGINVNVLVTTYNGAGYLSHNYEVTGNTINLSVCYWFNVTSPVYQISKDFIINVPNNVNYIINVSTFNSSSQTICDNYSVGPTATTNYLENKSFNINEDKYLIFPNPCKGIIEFKGNELLVTHVEIYDNLGRVQKKVTENSIKSLDVNELNDGIYFIKIETENGLFTQKLILKK